MSDIPEFPSRLKPFTADELTQEEERQGLEAERAERDKRRQQERDRLEARYQKAKPERRRDRFERIKARYRERGNEFAPSLSQHSASIPLSSLISIKSNCFDCHNLGPRVI